MVVCKTADSSRGESRSGWQPSHQPNCSPTRGPTRPRATRHRGRCCKIPWRPCFQLDQIYFLSSANNNKNGKKTQKWGNSEAVSLFFRHTLIAGGGESVFAGRISKTHSGCWRRHSLVICSRERGSLSQTLKLVKCVVWRSGFTFWCFTAGGRCSEESHLLRFKLKSNLQAGSVDGGVPTVH